MISFVRFLPGLFLLSMLPIFMGLSGCASSTGGIVEQNTLDNDPKNIVNQVLGSAFSQVGKPYKYGGTKPETGFDCSGFVGWAYGEQAIKLPRITRDMYGSGVAVSRLDLIAGDLVFFGRKKRITHVGIYTKDNKYIHSPRSGKGIQESSLDARAPGEYYVGARRIVGSADSLKPTADL